MRRPANAPPFQGVWVVALAVLLGACSVTGVDVAPNDPVVRRIRVDSEDFELDGAMVEDLRRADVVVVRIASEIEEDPDLSVLGLSGPRGATMFWNGPDDGGRFALYSKEFQRVVVCEEGAVQGLGARLWALDIPFRWSYSNGYYLVVPAAWEDAARAVVGGFNFGESDWRWIRD